MEKGGYYAIVWSNYAGDEKRQVFAHPTIDGCCERLLAISKNFSCSCPTLPCFHYCISADQTEVCYQEGKFDRPEDKGFSYVEDEGFYRIVYVRFGDFDKFNAYDHPPWEEMRIPDQYAKKFPEPDTMKMTFSPPDPPHTCFRAGCSHGQVLNPKNPKQVRREMRAAKKAFRDKRRQEEKAMRDMQRKANKGKHGSH